VFSGTTDGGLITSGLTSDNAGNLYGVTQIGGDPGCDFGYGCGVVFELSPPAPGQSAWTQIVLHAFHAGSDGQSPSAPPIFYGAHALLGTTLLGGSACNCGTVYLLTPPEKGQGVWTESIVYTLKGPPDGDDAVAGLTPDGTGRYVMPSYYGGSGTCAFNNLPTGCGAILRLEPSVRKGDTWTESVLYSLPAQSTGAIATSPLLIDPAGTIYGATYVGGSSKYCGGSGCGVAFSLTP
jgi:hypothetical protein